MFRRSRLLCVAVVLMVGLTIFGQIVRMLITRDVSQFVEINREMDKLLAEAKIDEPSRVSMTVKDRTGQTSFDATRLDRKRFLEMSGNSQKVFDRITLRDNVRRGTFALQAALVLLLIVAIYRTTTTTASLGLATRIAALFALPLALLFFGSTVVDLPPKFAGLRQLSEFGKWGYPLSWLFSLLLLRKHLANRILNDQLEPAT